MFAKVHVFAAIAATFHIMMDVKVRILGLYGSRHSKLMDTRLAGTGLDKVIEFIQRKKSENAGSPQQPPTKRRRLADATVPHPKEADSPHCIVVFREKIKFNFCESESEPKGAIEYTTFGNDVKTHIAKTDDGETVRLIVSELRNDEYKSDLIDVVLPMSSADFELIAVASKVTHLQNDTRDTGRFWVETTFKTVPGGLSHKLMATWELKWSTVSTLQEVIHPMNDNLMIMDWMIKRLLPTHALDIRVTPPEFYKCINVPPRADAVASHLKVAGLKPKLYPYQGRSVRWMLRREGVDWSPVTKSLIPISKEKSVTVLHKTMDVDGQQCWISPIFDLVTTSKTNFSTEDVSGGLLLEEMGLGKREISSNVLTAY